MTNLFRLIGVVILLFSAASHAVQQGDSAIHAFGTDMDGNPVLPESLRGQVVVTLYWASWCGYCRMAMPDFTAFQKVAKDRGLQVVFINAKENRGVFREAARWAKSSTVIMAHDRKGKAMEQYGVESYPHIMLIDRQGVIRRVSTGYGEQSREFYATRLAELLDEKPANSEQEQAATPIATES